MSSATIQTKTRSIMFIAPMVRAILEGRKTQTRRVVKPQPESSVADAVPKRDYPHGPATEAWYWRPLHGHYTKTPTGGWDITCPYGKPGDMLWVREAFHRTYDDRGFPFTVFLADLEDRLDFPYVMTSGRFMPKHLARLWLRVTDVRVERLHDISESDARAEGAEERLVLPGDCVSYVAGFAHRWDEINHKRPGCSWDLNPWVWVVSFERTEVPRG